MTGKQTYEERRRLEAENRLRREQREAERYDSEEEQERAVKQFFADVSRIADALERLAGGAPDDQ